MHGGHVRVYPEGRIGLTPDGWLERERTGIGVPVLSVSQWGAPEVLQYANDRGWLRTAVRAIVRRPVQRVHVGPPVRFDDLRPGRIGDANRARHRIAAAITRGLVTLRAADRGRAFADATRPTTGTAASPGGVVPDAP